MRPLNMLRNRRGVALPLSLLGLVIVAFLVTAAIVTSGTEILSSAAHRDATTALYSADAALEEYVVDKSNLAPLYQDSLYPVIGDTRISGFEIDVARLYSMLDTTGLGTGTLSDDTVWQYQTYSVLARPTSGRGRSIGALMQTVRSAQRFAITMQAGLTVGGNVKVSGNSTISDGRNTGCDTAQYALQVTSGSSITVDGSAKIEGATDTTSFDKSELVNQYLGGMTIPEAAALATIKFAAGEFVNKPNSAPNGVPLDPVPSNKYNWGCPAADSTCVTVSGNEKNRTYYPSVAIDAGGTKVVLTGDHGQGILLVHNGSLEIQGNFVYEGIILVEQDLSIKGTGTSSGGVKIDGAVMALGENSTVDDNATGNAVITYNKCAIDTAQANANSNQIAVAPQQFPSRTQNWFEMVQ